MKNSFFNNANIMPLINDTKKRHLHNFHIPFSKNKGCYIYVYIKHIYNNVRNFYFPKSQLTKMIINQKAYPNLYTF